MSAPAPQLIRAVGLFSATLIAVNGMVGSGIFVLPAVVAKLLGPAALSAYLSAGLATALIVLCFAEVGSKFDRSGGPYLYARVVFGDWVGFGIGWMTLLARITSVAAISNAFTSYLGFFWPVFASGPGRVAAITAALAALTIINIRGVRYGTFANDVLTVSKLAALSFFVIAGLFFLDPNRPPAWTLPDPANLRQASLLLIFAFGGFEFASVPGDELVRPKRNLPIAMLLGTAIVAVLYFSIQFVAQGTLPDLAASATPLASAGRRFLGEWGGLLLTAGAIISTTGTNSALMLVTPRIIYAMADGGQLPAIFARVHPRLRTPVAAIIAAGVIGWASAMYSQFASLAAISAIARLLSYMATCLAVPVLRRRTTADPGAFRLPGGILIPAAALALSVWMLMGSTRNQILISAATLLAGYVLYVIHRRTASRRDLPH